MSIQFSRSIRSLNIDSFRASRIGLIIGSLLMLTLILWFFLARVSVHETSQEVILENGRFLSTFTEESLARIQPGQDVLVRMFSTSDEPPLTVQGVVFDVFPDSNQVEVIIISEDFFYIPSLDNVNAQVDIEIEQVTPFNLIMRYSGQYIETEQAQENSQSANSANTP